MPRLITGTDLRRQRLRMGWSRDQLAHSVGVTAETVASWEEGSEKINCPAVVEQILRQYDPDAGQTAAALPR